MKFRIYTVKVTATDFCHACQHECMIYRRRLNHTTQLLLTTMTFGLWSIAWMALWIASFRRPWRCTICRRKVTKSAPTASPRGGLITAAPWE